MNSCKAIVDESIADASTLPSSFYTREDMFNQVRNRIFVKSWQLVADTSQVKVPGQVYPFRLLDDFIGEPLLLTRDHDDSIHCISNVCTHRGTLVAECPGNVKSLRCRYHGRKFSLCGAFQSMPEFKEVNNFPAETDNLAPVPFKVFKRFIFTCLEPAHTFEALTAEMEERVGWMPFEDLIFDHQTSRDYLVSANWALYCDNYLEGFHIPYVHAGLSEIIDYGSYTTEIFPFASLQLGLARDSELAFELPENSPDYGKEVGAYYFWLFPNTMFSIYPWGVSVNVVKPVSPERTRVAFLNYLWDEDRFKNGAWATMDRVEREDEAIVESIQLGMQSRIYSSGRFSVAREQGVHHFHRLISAMLESE